MASAGFAECRGRRLWYHVSEPAPGPARTPLLLLHGGPGGTSALFEPLDALAASGRQVIRFDQLGSGQSDRPRDPSCWHIAGVLEQIAAVRDRLGLERIHLLGHSWGGMVALEYMLTAPAGVDSVTLCSALASVRLWVDECRRLRAALPRHVADGLERCERSFATRVPPPAGAGDQPRWTATRIERQAALMGRVFPVLSHPASARIASWMSHLPPLRRPAYEILGLPFVARHVCRARPVPAGVFRFLAGMNREIYEVLWGPSEFFASGLLKDWDIRARLAEIAVPTLVLSGRHDEATPAHMQVLRDAIPGAAQVVLDRCSHCGMWEDPDAYRSAIAAFLDRVEDRRPTPGGAPAPG